MDGLDGNGIDLYRGKHVYTHRLIDMFCFFGRGVASWEESILIFSRVVKCFAHQGLLLLIHTTITEVRLWRR